MEEAGLVAGCTAHSTNPNHSTDMVRSNAVNLSGCAKSGYAARSIAAVVAAVAAARFPYRSCEHSILLRGQTVAHLHSRQ
jgi:hypothetical protein